MEVPMMITALTTEPEQLFWFAQEWRVTKRVLVNLSFFEIFSGLNGLLSTFSRCLPTLTVLFFILLATRVELLNGQLKSRVAKWLGLRTKVLLREQWSENSALLPRFETLITRPRR